MSFHKLSESARRHLSPEQFAIKKGKRYPINDRQHAELALDWSRNRPEAGEVRAAVKAKYPDLG